VTILDHYALVALLADGPTGAEIGMSLREEHRIVTADPPVARAARAEGIEIVALPESAGRRP